MTLTQIDLKEIGDVIEEKVDDKTKNLPTKDEFFNQMDQIMGELSKIRESQELLTHKVYQDHEERIEKIEGKVQIQGL